MNPYQRWVERYTKTEGGAWLLQSYEDLTAPVLLTTGSVTLTLADF